MKKRSGFTLIEALLTLALTGAVLGMASYLLGNYSNVLRFAATKDASFLALQVSLNRIASEVRGSVRVLTPLPGTTAPASELKFEKINPAFATWLPATVPTTLPTVWDPYPPAQMQTVRIFLSPGQALTRQVGTEQAVLAPGLESFSVRLVTPSSLEIRLDFRESNQTRQYKARVFRALP